MNKRASRFIRHNREISTSLIIMILTLSVLVASNYPPESIVKELEQPAKFVLASWEFPDGYGQGVDKISVYSNQTGSWVIANWAGDASREYFESSAFDWNVSIFIRLNVWTWFNSTLTGAADWEDGKNFQRHNVVVTTVNGTVFSQQNFTFANAFPAIDPPMWYYEYEVILEFLPVAGEIYKVVVTYEIYY